MRILLVSSWGTACGIADFGAQLAEAVYAADSTLHVIPCPEGLDPAALPPADTYDVVFLNFHLGLHSRWQVGHIVALQQAGKPVVIDFHDSRGEVEPDIRQQSLYDVADAFIVHEPCLGLPRAHVIRQGVRDWPGEYLWDASRTGWTNGRPILGTIGFNFPWKNFDRLAQVTAEAGWAFLVLSNNASTLDEAKWLSSNPHTKVVRGFLPTGEIVQKLAGCDATVFAYECANSGTSGAIRLGLAARKPVIAWKNCRQFRDLYLEEQYRSESRIDWCTGFDDLPYHLAEVPIQRLDPGIVALATRDAWANQAAKYAAIFHSAEETSMSELVWDVTTGLDYAPAVHYDETKPTGHLRRQFSTARLQEALGWVPATSFTTGLAKTISWTLTDHPDPFNPRSHR